MQHRFYTIKSSGRTRRLSSQWKWDVGVSALVIRPRHRVKKQQAAAAAAALSEPHTSSGCWVSMEQLCLRRVESRHSYRPSSYHPAAWRWRLWVALSCKKASEAGGQTDQCSRTRGQGFDLLHDVPRTVLPSVCPSVPFSVSSADPQLTDLSSFLFISHWNTEIMCLKLPRWRSNRRVSVSSNKSRSISWQPGFESIACEMKTNGLQ